jgi:peptide/nickel transport system permease protein
MGVLAAVHRGKAIDHVVRVVGLAGYSIPVFWLGLMALWLFWYKLRISPGTGYVPIGTSFGGWLSHMIMPWVVLALLYAAFYARMVRANLIETMGEDYIRTARAKGLSERRVIFKHALRPTLTPIVTIFGLDIGLVLGGAILTETTFSLNGIGKYAIDSIVAKDLPVILGVTLMGAVFIVICNLVVDLLYPVVDPRVRIAH